MRMQAKSTSRVRGMTLVEMLVTLVSASVGLLGIAALQLVSLRSNQEAYLRLQASALADSILDRIRANPKGFIDAEYDNIVFNGTGTAGTRAGTDLKAWQAEVDRLLPGGANAAAGAIRRKPSSNVVTITIRWGKQGDRNSAPGSATGTLQTWTEI